MSDNSTLGIFTKEPTAAEEDPLKRLGPNWRIFTKEPTAAEEGIR